MILKCSAELTPQGVVSIRATCAAHTPEHLTFLTHLKKKLEGRRPEVFLDIHPEDELQIRILL